MSLEVLFSRASARHTVTAARTHDGKRLDFVASLVGRAPFEEAWRCTLSTLVGCPVRCTLCDAGGQYEGRLTARELLAQLELMVLERLGSRAVPTREWQVHFTRMGEPAFNDAVLDALELLPQRFDAPGLWPLLSTVAPASCAPFFERLLEVKARLYPQRMTLQLSLHTTSEAARRAVVPVRTMSYPELAAYGRRFKGAAAHKVQLSLLPLAGLPMDAEALAAVFSPDAFSVKLAPLTPTSAVERAGLLGGAPLDQLAGRFAAAGYQVQVELVDEVGTGVGAACGLTSTGLRLGTPVPRRTRTVAVTS